MEVTCPEGVEPGDTVSFTTHDGREMTATVPDGVASGETFTVAVDDDDACTSPAKPEEGACRQPTRALVYDLVEHAQRLLEIDMAPVLEARCHLFDQDVEELTSGQGETFEQYAAFQEFEGLLEAHCERFVAERGFASAAECFAAIDRTVAEDAARQQREMAVLHERLRAVQREPIGAGELLEQTLSLTEYPTFSSLMRLKARQVRQRREFLAGAEGRAREREERTARLAAMASAPEAMVSATDGELLVGGVRDLWDELQQRVLAQLPKAFPPQLRALIQAEADAEVRLLNKLLGKGKGEGGGTEGGGAAQEPSDDEEKRELFQLCATSLSKCGRNAPPQLAAVVVREIHRVKAAIDAAEMGSLPLLFECLKSAHGLMDAAEQSVEQIMAAAEAKSAGYLLQFEAAQH